MIGTGKFSAAVQAMLGPAHSPVTPATLYSGWLDGSFAVLSMTGLTVPHSAFGPSGDGVANTSMIDGGLCPATVPTHFGLFDAASGGALWFYAPVTFGSTPVEDDPLTAAPGELVFTLANPA